MIVLKKEFIPKYLEYLRKLLEKNLPDSGFEYKLLDESLRIINGKEGGRDVSSN